MATAQSALLETLENTRGPLQDINRIRPVKLGTMARLPLYHTSRTLSSALRLPVCNSLGHRTLCNIWWDSKFHWRCPFISSLHHEGAAICQRDITHSGQILVLTQTKPQLLGLVYRINRIVGFPPPVKSPSLPRTHPKIARESASRPARAGFVHGASARALASGKWNHQHYDVVDVFGLEMFSQVWSAEQP